jgi:hypothetical protein
MFMSLITVPIFQDPVRNKLELEKRENELKEKALRNKVMRTRKGSSS